MAGLETLDAVCWAVKASEWHCLAWPRLETYRKISMYSMGMMKDKKDCADLATAVCHG